jgi:Protein of unknown function (DUF2591)
LILGKVFSAGSFDGEVTQVLGDITQHSRFLLTSQFQKRKKSFRNNELHFLVTTKRHGTLPAGVRMVESKLNITQEHSDDKPQCTRGNTMNVMRLDGRLLNYWVAKSAGLTLGLSNTTATTRDDRDGGTWHPHTYNPASNWAQAAPIIADEWFSIEDTLLEWFGPQWSHIAGIADNPLKWFMRAYVATQYGNEVEDSIPIEASQFANDSVVTRLPLNSQPERKSFATTLFHQILW